VYHLGKYFMIILIMIIGLKYLGNHNDVI